MKIAIGCDHGGFAVKPIVLDEVKKLGHAVIDCGAGSLDPSDDYPDFAQRVAEAVAGGRAERGIVICGSGVGACVTANKLPGVRAAICHDSYSAHQGVEHDDLNVLCLGARIIGPELASELIRAFLNARFSGEERHRRRLGKVRAIERQYQRVERDKEDEHGA